MGTKWVGAISRHAQIPCYDQAEAPPCPTLYVHGSPAAAKQ